MYSVLICDDSMVARKQVAKCLPPDWEVAVHFAGNLFDGEITFVGASAICMRLWEHILHFLCDGIGGWFRWRLLLGAGCVDSLGIEMSFDGCYGCWFVLG